MARSSCLSLRIRLKEKGRNLTNNSILFSTNKLFVESTFRSNLVHINPKEADSGESNECP